MADSEEPPEGLLQFYESSLDFGRKTQAEYSKWLINTLYLLHTGSIAGVVTRAPPEKLVLFLTPLSHFIGGVSLGFLAGLITWANYHWFNRVYSVLIQSIRRSEWKRGWLPRFAWTVSATLWLALIFGTLSFACLVRGAWLTLQILATLK